MMIREANLETDALSIVDGAHDFLSAAVYRRLYPADRDEFVSVIGRVVSTEGVETLVANADGRVVGGIAMMYAPYLWNPALLVAELLFLWAISGAPPRTRHLVLEEAMRRVDKKKAFPIFRALVKTPSVGCVYRGLGLEPIETAFARLN